MLQTINQYNLAGWPVPGTMVTVDSPLAGALFLTKILMHSEQNPSWKKAWEIFWDSLPKSVRLHLPKKSIPTIYPKGFERISGSRRFNNDQDIIADLLIQQQVFADLVGERELSNDGRQLQRTLHSYLNASRCVDGVMSWAFTGIGIECLTPVKFHRDERRRPHSEIGPSIEYSDGWKLFAWHGVRIPANAIVAPQTITVTQIESTTNAEVRRVLIERMGIATYVAESRSIEVSQDRFGVLLRKDVPGDESIFMVRVVNSTPEPDGHFKTYHLRVHPSCRTAREGVAWTFGMTADEYDPKIES